MLILSLQFGEEEQYRLSGIQLLTSSRGLVLLENGSLSTSQLRMITLDPKL
jgi:hypothetical protein